MTEEEETAQLAERMREVAGALHRAGLPANARTGLALFELALHMFRDMGAPWDSLRRVIDEYAKDAPEDSDPEWPR